MKCTQLTCPVYWVHFILGALCHSIESIWSVNATSIAKRYAKEAICLIKDNYKDYLSGNNEVIPSIQKAANLAGKAINISQTTAAHAMSYKITSLYKIPHGLAVSLTLPHLYQLLVDNKLEAIKEEPISLEEFKNIFSYMELEDKIKISDEELDILVNNVNPIRLGNYPLSLTIEDIKNIYNNIYINIVII